jgi:hypothetical protein
MKIVRRLWGTNPATRLPWTQATAVSQFASRNPSRNFFGPGEIPRLLMDHQDSHRFQGPKPALFGGLRVDNREINSFDSLLVEQ